MLARPLLRTRRNRKVLACFSLWLLSLLGSPSAGVLPAAEYSYSFVNPAGMISDATDSLNPDTVTASLWYDNSLASQPIKGLIVNFDLAAGANLYADQAWRNFAAANNLAIMRFPSVIWFSYYNSTQIQQYINTSLANISNSSSNSELSSSTLPLILTGLSKDGTYGAIDTGWLYGSNRTVACVGFHGNSLYQYEYATTPAAKTIPVLYPIAQLDPNDPNVKTRQTDIDSWVRTGAPYSSTNNTQYSLRNNGGVFWTTTMQYGYAHNSTGDDAYTLQWLGRVWNARYNPAAPGALNPIAPASSSEGNYTLTNPNTTSCTLTGLSTAPYSLPQTGADKNTIWIPPGGASEWLAASTAPVAGVALNMDSSYNTLYTAPESILDRRFINSGTITFSGSGTIGLDNSGGGHPNYFEMTGGTLQVVRGATLQNGGWQGGVWTNNRASLYIDGASTFDIWDGLPVYVDALSGSGKATIGLLNGQVNWAGNRSLTVGVQNGSGTFSGTIAGNPANGDGGSIGLTKTGAGRQILSGNNTYSGGTIINGGTLAVAGGGNLGNRDNPLAIANSATLDLGGTTQVVGQVGGKGIVGTIQNGTLNIQSNNMYFQSGTLSADLTSNARSSGRLWIGGDPNATVFLGGNNRVLFADGNSTIIGYPDTTGAAGIVKLIGPTALGPGSEAAQLFTGILDLNGQKNVTVGSLLLAFGGASTLINGNTSQEAIYGNPINLNGQTPNIGGPGNLTLGGAITNGGLKKVGSGTLILSGSSNHFVGTVVESGTLILTNAGAIGNGSSLTVGAGGTLLFDPSAASAPVEPSLALSLGPPVTPLPEPGTLSLLGAAGIVAAAVWRRGRNGRKA